jgi:hypothetical protein
MVALTLMFASAGFSVITERKLRVGFSLPSIRSLHDLIDYLPYLIALFISLGVAEQSPGAASVFLVIHASILRTIAGFICRVENSEEFKQELGLVLSMGLGPSVWRLMSFQATLALCFTVLPLIGLVCVLMR